MNYSTSGFTILNYFLELAQTHFHCVNGVSQPAHPLLLLCLPAFNLSQHQGLFQWVSSHINWPKYWSFSFSISLSNEYSMLISFVIDWFDLLAVQGDSLESSLAPQFKSMNSSVLSLLYGPAHPYMTTEKNMALNMDLCWQSDVSAF